MRYELDYRSMSARIALDHDGTFTALPEIWIKFIEMVRAAGGEVFCITSRFPNVPINGFPGEVHYTCGQPKWEWAHEHGIHVDIWVDDWPSCIGEHPERRGTEPPQAAQRKYITRQLFDRMKFTADGGVSL
jgi:hypothetical protein